MNANTRAWRRTVLCTSLGVLLASACGPSSSEHHDDGGRGDADAGAAGAATAGAMSGGAGSPNDGGSETTQAAGANTASAAGGATGGGAGMAGAPVTGGAGGETGVSDCTQPFAHSLEGWNGYMPDGVCTVDHVCQVAPLPGNFDMTDIWGTSSSDLWVVGDGGSIVHFDGQTWTGIKSIGEPPNFQFGDGAAFRSVHGTAANDVWVLGQYNQLLHFDGIKWSSIAYDGKIKARTLWAQAACDVWLFGEAGQASHFDGQGWTDMSVGSNTVLYDAVGFASDDVWAAGGETVVHWNGKNWVNASSGLKDVADVRAIWGANADDLWAISPLKQFRKQAGGVWQDVHATGVYQDPFDVNGSATDDVLLPPNERFNGTGYDNIVVGKKVWTAGRHDYWGIDVVEKTSDVHLRHLAEQLIEYNREPYGVTFAPDPETLYRSRSTGVGYTNVIERRVNGQYVEEATGLASSLALSGNSATDVWVVDNTSCDTSHFDGAKWTKVVSGPGAHQATRVAVAPDGNAWIGCGPRLAHFESGTWTLKKTFADAVVQVAASNDRVWVVTLSMPQEVAHVFEVANGVVTPMLKPIEPSVDTPQLAGVDDAGRLWASSMNGYASFYAEGVWHNFPHRVGAMSVRGSEVWFTDYPAYVTYRFDGGGMKSFSTVCGPFASRPVIAGPGDVWFSNEGGMCHWRN